MGEMSKIEWTDHTFNPWIGCAKVSEGCANCYAEALMDKRMGKAKWGPNGTRRRTSAAWKLPPRWDRKARREHRMAKVFCASLADVFEDRPELVPWRDELLSLIHTTPNLYWQLLTKRPENVLRMVDDLRYPLDGLLWDQFRERVWMGTSAENQEMLDKRVPELRHIPARVRWLSCEPLLGPLVVPEGIDWVVVGGESGPHARPCNVEWIRDIVRQCRAAGVACFVKQLGSNPFWVEPCGVAGPIPNIVLDSYLAAGMSEPEDIDHPLHMRHPKGGDPAEWPADLRVREFPTVEPKGKAND
ncbi:MAG TPA: DUF5131 family protein [Bryobacteraceae bacterium]|nr:DUF5131 family protein [Bryobacteraceae bacterium]